MTTETQNWRVEEGRYGGVDGESIAVMVVTNGYKTIWPWQLQKMADMLNWGNEYKAEAERLFQLLDDIDTVDDAAKFDDSAYRAQVRRVQAKRWQGPITTDGYSLRWFDATPTPTPTPASDAQVATPDAQRGR